MIIGYETGYICFIDIEKKENLKISQNIHELHAKIICLKTIY
jgi:hypothetical protein